MGHDVISPEIAAAITNDHLHLIVNPTERCNLRCTYCYETFVLKKMPASVIRGVVNLVRRRSTNGLKSFQLEFFGGEPLVAWDVVEQLSSDLSKVCNANGTAMLGGMTTNGTLLDRSRLDHLVANQVRAYQITLDGPEEVHDQRRVTRKGAGSFNTVWRKLEMLKASIYPLEVLIRLHFDPTTVEKFLGDAGLIARICKSFTRGDERFRLHFHALGRWGGPNDKETPVFQSAIDESIAVEKLVAEAVSVGCLPQQLLQFRRDAALGESGHAICYAARSNAFVIRSDGRVAKCTVAFEDDRNTVGTLAENGDLIIDHNRHLPWLNGLITGDPLALSCPALVYLWGKDTKLVEAV